MKNDMNDIVVRLKRLEDAVFGTRAPSKKISIASTSSGPKGGILQLISKGFFGKKKVVAEVVKKLEEQDYHYSATVVQTALRRLSTVKGSLVALTEGGVKHYVIRK